MNKLRYKVYTFKHSLYTFIFPIHRIYMIEKTKAKNLKKLAGWEILFIPISPMRLCPTPCTVMRYKGLNLPSVLDMSHSKPWVERSGGEWTENPWSGQGLLSQWSRVLAHISCLLPGCLRSAISTLYSFKVLVGHLWPA